MKTIQSQFTPNGKFMAMVKKQNINMGNNFGHLQSNSGHNKKYTNKLILDKNDNSFIVGESVIGDDCVV